MRSGRFDRLRRYKKLTTIIATQALEKAIAKENTITNEIRARCSSIQQEIGLSEAQQPADGAIETRALWLSSEFAPLRRQETERAESKAETVRARSSLVEAMTEEALISALIEAEESRSESAEKRSAEKAFALAAQAQFAAGRRPK